MTQDSAQVPTWFKVTSILLLIWNLLGVMAFVMQMMLTPEMIAAMPQAEQDLYNTTPAWATIAFGCAVIGGALGCLLLVMKKASAFYLLVISLLGVLIQMFHSFFMSKSFEVFGPGGMIMPIMVIVIAIGLVWFAKDSEKKGWIN